MTLEVISPTAALLDGRYVLHDRVGQGGMATVYRAEDTHLGRIVAIKMIHGEGPVASIERAHTEKALLASLSHPALVTLHDAQLAPNRPQYLVMEFVDGPTLAGRMAEGPLPPRDVARITRDLAEGLAVVHAAGIVHRDVKPSNVLLARGRSGRPLAAKLADFGIACSIENTRLTTPGIVLGTLTYMAPEQLRDADPSTPVDIFALGLVVLEALSGETGYAALGSGRAAAIARLAQPPTISQTVPEEWRDLLTRMTRLEPEERPNAAEVARAAREILRGYASTGGDRSSPAASADAAVAGAVAVAAAAVGASGVDAASAAASSDSKPVSGPDADGGATSETKQIAGATGETAVLDASSLPPTRVRTRSRPRSRRKMLVGAAGLVATGALVVGLAAFTAPNPDLGRVASSVAVRTAVTPAEAEPAGTEPAGTEPAETVIEEVPAAPVEVTDSGDQGNGNKEDKGNSGNSGNSDKGNSGNSGNSDKGQSNGKTPKEKDK